MLARFEAGGLVSRRRSETDARRQDIELTGAGRAAAAELDTRPARQIGELLSGVDGPRLLDAMREITGLLGGPAPRTVVLRPPSSGDLGWVVQRHGAVYAEEFGWNQDFESYVARLAAGYLDIRRDERAAAWIAGADGFTLVSEERVHSFGQELTAQDWARSLV